MDKNQTATDQTAMTADELLSRMEAEQSAEAASISSKPVVMVEETKLDDKLPSDAEVVESEPVDTEKTDTRAETEKVAEKPIAEEIQTKEPAIALSDEDKKKFSAYLKQTQSKFGADLGKRLVRWDTIKQLEQTIESQKQKTLQELQAARQAFDRDVQAYKAEQEASNPTPDKYEIYAAKQIQLAASKETEANQAEEAGDFDKAVALRDEAKFAKRYAEDATKSAEYLRNNPPVALQKQQQQFVEHQKNWINKAAIDFPEFAKSNSQLQVATTEVFKQIMAQHPEVAKMPALVYYCARIAKAESDSARVPALTKELQETKAKLEELNALTNPTPSGGATRQPTGEKPFEAMTPEEQFDVLRRDAMAMP